MQESKLINFDVDQIAYLSSNTTTTTTSAQMITYINNEYWVDVCLCSNAAGVNISDVASFRGAVGNLGSTPLIQVPNALFNNVAAWSGVDKAVGQINLYLDMAN